jgi:hypothetical protein
VSWPWHFRADWIGGLLSDPQPGQGKNVIQRRAGLLPLGSKACFAELGDKVTSCVPHGICTCKDLFSLRVVYHKLSSTTLARADIANPL